MSPNEEKAVKFLLYPEIAVNIPLEDKSIDIVEVLDKKQEELAYRLGSGHRIIYGVAGSGKTVILIKKAKILSEIGKEDFNILFLCYNRPLMNIIRRKIQGKSCDIYSFHSWALKNGVQLKNGFQWKSPKELGDVVCERFQNENKLKKYDAILIDEGQDFHPTWFKAARLALTDSENGNLVIAFDKNQGINDNIQFKWSEVGVKARGRAYYLRKNYRNTKQILKSASLFAVFGKDQSDEDEIKTCSIDPECCIREGVKPLLVRCKTHSDECELVASLIEKIKILKDMDPAEIGILYPYATNDQKSLLKSLETRINAFSSAIWITDDMDNSKKDKMGEKGVKILTIKSSKGFDFKAVIILFSDQRNFHDDLDAGKMQLYVGMTRARDYLWLLHSEMSDLMIPLYDSDSITKKPWRL